MDLRTSLRRLWNSRGFAATAIITLAICLGTNAAIFTIVNRVLLNPLPVPESSRIMLMANQFPNTGAGRADTSAPRNYYDRLRGVSAFSEQALFAATDRVITLDRNSVQIHGMIATASLFRLLRVDAALGRTFTSDEEEIGMELRVILSHDLWRELYGQSPTAIGSYLRIDSRSYEIVGVLPERFSFFDPAVRFWIPLAFTPAERTNPIANNWYNIGRLAPNATREQAQSQVDAVNAAFLDSVPRLREVYKSAGYHTTVDPLADALVRGIRRILYLLWGGAIVVLVMGTINIGNLTLAQAQLHARDLATRLALGAGLRRLAATLLAASLLIALAGGLLGLLLGFVILRSLHVIRLDSGFVLPGLGFTPGVAGFVLTLAILAGAAIGAAPVVQLKRLDLTAALREHGRSSTRGRGAGWFRKVLIVLQIALTFTVLTGAGVFLLTLRNLLSVNPGFSTDNVISAAINLPRERYPNTVAVRGFLDRALTAIRTTPGVISAAASTVTPFSGARRTQAVIPEGPARDAKESIATPTWVSITPGFFQTLGVALLDGRDFDAGDVDQDAGVVIVDETAAHRLWPRGNALGQRLFLPGVRNVLRVSEKTRWLTVVAVVPELRLEQLSGGTNTAGMFFTLFSEANSDSPPRGYVFAMKTASDPATIIGSVRAAMAGIDQGLALYDVQTLQQRASLSLARERLAMFLASAFGCVALLLAALGIYGVLSYLVAQRTRELGIRMVLGSTPGGVFTLVLREGVVLVGGGLALGIGGALLLRPLFARLSYGVRFSDPLLVGSVIFAIVAVSLAACLSPARRATRLDPLVVLNDTIEY